MIKKCFLTVAEVGGYKAVLELTVLPRVKAVHPTKTLGIWLMVVEQTSMREAFQCFNVELLQRPGHETQGNILNLTRGTSA